MTTWSTFLLKLSVFSNFYAGIKSVELDFGIFEHFVANAEIFTLEQEIVQQLQVTRSALAASAKAYRSPNSSRDSLLLDLSHQKSLHFSHHHEIVAADLYVKSPSKDPLDILKGALNAVLLLANTYELSPKHLMRGDVLSSRHGTGEGRESLQADDALMLAYLARDNKMYNSAVDFVREANKLFANYSPPEMQRYSLDNHLQQELVTAKNEMVALHNKYLTQRQHHIGADHYTHPYVVDGTTLCKKAKQPKFVRNHAWKTLKGPRDNMISQVKFQRICNHQLIGEEVKAERRFHKCRFIHHSDPYVKLGPFKVEILLDKPMRTIFHDILTEDEMNFLVDYSKPKLSNVRQVSAPLKHIKKADLRSGKKGGTVNKSNQVWVAGKNYTEPEEYTLTSSVPPQYKMADMAGDYRDHTVQFPQLVALSTKIELATNFVVNSRFAASAYQVTNYG